MVDTAMSRGYAWGLQTDFVTQKTIAAGALRKIIVTDENTIDYEPQINNDESWSHGKNQATEQWLEAHDGRVSHTMPAFVDELGRPLVLNLGDYAVTIPSGGTTSKQHSFKPQDPAVSRQGKAVTYAETTGPGWNVLMPRAVGDGFTLRGDEKSVLTMDFGLQGAGKIDPASTATWSGGTPTVVTPTNRAKFFNTQMALKATPSGESQVVYACRYRAFEVNYRQSLLLEAGYKPGCGEFNTPGDPTSGLIRSALEFDKQMVDFSFEVDMASGSPELVLVQNQKAIDILIEATGAIIEGAIRQRLSVFIPVAHYSTSKPSVKNGIYTFTITGSGFFDYATSKLLEVQLVNTIASYATGW
ncbi:MAG: hypothetical protein ABI539_15135 [Acidobacteriota bacterium]